VLVCVRSPEILSYIETFNAIQDKYKLEVMYSSAPQDVLSDKSKDPDLVIGEGLASPSSMKKLESLGKLIIGKDIHNSLFYPQSFDSCSFENELKLLPLSFTLPTVVFKKGTLKDIVADDKRVTIEELKKISIKSNEVRGEKFIRMGFYPLWGAEFVYKTAQEYGSDFSWNSSSVLSWKKESLDQASSYLASWYKEIPGKVEMFDEFSSSYINQPYYQLVNKGEIFCYLTDSNSFYKIPEEKRKVLEIRWLSRDSKIFVNDEITYIGIPKRAKRKEGASLFLRWLFLPDTQMKLLEINHFKRQDGTYGIAGGFSTLKDINETYIPQHYPIFSGLIPESDSLVFPHVLPDKWKKFKSEVFYPWLAGKMTAGASTVDLETQLDFFK
jgi:hypothetical protein